MGRPNIVILVWVTWLAAVLAIVAGLFAGAYIGAWTFEESKGLMGTIIGGLMISFAPSPMQASRTRAADQPNGGNRNGHV